MAEELDSFDFRPGNSIYPWEEWMTGKWVLLHRGKWMWQMFLPKDHKDHKDFIVDPESFRTAGYAWADRNGYKVSISLPQGSRGQSAVIKMTGRKRKKDGTKPYAGWKEGDAPRFGSDPADINY
jgi:hypothetical protein